MKMNLNLAPSGTAMLRQSAHVPSIILLGGIEVRVREGLPIGVSPSFHSLWILATPAFDARFLLHIWRARHPIVRHNRRLKMICHRDDKMNLPFRHPARRPLPDEARNDPQTIRQLLRQSRSAANPLGLS